MASLTASSGGPLDEAPKTASAQLASVEMTQLNQQFSAAVILPVYQSLAEQTEQLALAAQRFEQTPSEPSLSAFRAAWMASASVWARSQAVAFGPVHSLGHGVALNFPADESGIDGLLLDDEAVEAATDLESAALLPSLQGFEAMAYLLYGDDGRKPASDFSARERQYLRRLAVTAGDVSADLLSVWQTGWNGYAAYDTLLATAGQPGNGAYLTVQAGTEEIVRGTINALDGVIGETIPHVLEAPEHLSEPSGEIVLRLLNSTVQGVQTAYVGSAATPALLINQKASRGENPQENQMVGGLGQWVAFEDEASDWQIRVNLAIALDRLKLSISNPSDTDTLASAQTFLENAKALLEQDVLPLVQIQAAVS